jgi:dTDP-4-dehydrorhamnose reductase
MECTVNRVGDRYFDQIERTGHASRPDDIDRLASLGGKTTRYPVLWERTAPDPSGAPDFRWAEERLSLLRSRGVRPIVGFMHHGSGPRYTSLLDPEMPEKLATYATAFAERFPWVDAYTPVNEPLTTARFSALYGHWYPHERSAFSFARAMLNQCRATALAMRAIRRVNPAAQLVQTEDLGDVRSSKMLAYQAKFENTRRWLTFDLLFGRVTRSHPMWGYLKWAGVPAKELDRLPEHACPPDILGLNYYVTSERFLDGRLDRYPPALHGGNGRHRYVDVEAVRVCEDGLLGPAALLKKAWSRYQIPIAVTEAHMGCTREEQMRWILEVWRGAERARLEGANVVAVTMWAVLGSFDWNSLVTREGGHYEPGAFDIRGPRPRETALARMARELAAGRELQHPVLSAPGWWRRSARLCFRTGAAGAESAAA